MRFIAIVAASSVVACGEVSVEPGPILEATGSYQGFWTFDVLDAYQWCEDMRGPHRCKYGWFGFPGYLEIVRETSSTLAGHFTIDTAAGGLVRDPLDLDVGGPDTTSNELDLHFADGGLL